ncbi:hypothetical protein ABZ614_41915 [Streptomyces sp. NPDC013178]|uniref:hypothetical protein n=1 Tax=Streptomyces sp. NPDC013178 TaxID=3155118 RepID=UPI0033D6A817
MREPGPGRLWPRRTGGAGARPVPSGVHTGPGTRCRRTTGDPTLIEEYGLRWTGAHVVLHTGDRPTHLGVFGYSGD